MMVLNFGGWFRHSLLLIFIFFQITAAATLITLAKATCLQRCFIPSCSNLESSCVCKSVLDTTTTSGLKVCAQGSCSEDSSYASLNQECSALLASSSTQRPISSSIISSSLATTPTTTSGTTTTITNIMRVPTTTPPYPTELSRFPTSTSIPISVTNDIVNTQTSASSGPQASETPENQDTNGPSLKQRALIAVFVLAPVSIVLILVALFMVIRRRKHARRSITSFAGVSGWNRSSVALAQPKVVGDEEQPFPPRVTDQVRVSGGRLSLFPKPPTFPAQVLRPPSIAAKTVPSKKTLPEVPPMSQHRPITTISEVSEVVSPAGDIGTFQTMDSELQRAFLEVRQGFRPNSTRSSSRTSMDWSMMIDISQSASRRDSEFSSKAESRTSDTRFSWQ